jgi:hypothetical protein
VNVTARIDGDQRAVSAAKNDFDGIAMFFWEVQQNG